MRLPNPRLFWMASLALSISLAHPQARGDEAPKPPPAPTFEQFLSKAFLICLEFGFVVIPAGEKTFVVFCETDTVPTPKEPEA